MPIANSRLLIIILMLVVAGAVSVLSGEFTITELGFVTNGGNNGEAALPPIYELTSMTTIVSGPELARPDWSPTTSFLLGSGQWISFDQLGNDGFADAYIMRPNGSEITCLTCNHPNLPNRHQGNAAWHPNGRYVVFQAEKGSHTLDDVHGPAKPGTGVYNDLYVMDLQAPTSPFPPYNFAVYQLTDVRSGLPAGGSLHAHFSRDGGKLLWGDWQKDESYYGDWQMAVADFVTSPNPHLENIQYHEPAKVDDWYETHDWSLDNARIYFTCLDVPKMNDNAMDICAMDFSNPNIVQRLTTTSGMNSEAKEWDEHAHLSPRNDAISWISSNGYGVKNNSLYGLWLKSELWLMAPDGSQQQRITYFNQSSHPHYTGSRTISADNAWNPEGIMNPQLALSVWITANNNISEIRVLNFSPAQ